MAKKNLKFSEERMIDEIRGLSLDMVNNANLEYSNMLISSAPFMYTLFKNNLVYDMDKPRWINRDRFILSTPKVSALMYATMYATSETFTLDELKSYGSLNSMLSTYPEYNLDRMIENTVTRDGEGIAFAVGSAMASKYLGDTYNTKKVELFNYNTYCLCSHNDLTEGITYEAITQAGLYKLDNLILIYDSIGHDDNGKITDLFLSLDWNVFNVKNNENLSEIDKALDNANKSTKPALIILNTNIKKDSIYEIHDKSNDKLTKEELSSMKEYLEIPSEYYVTESFVRESISETKDRNSDNYAEWYSDYETISHELKEDEVEKLNDLINNEKITLKVDTLVDIEKLFIDKPLIDINYQIMNVISSFLPHFLGIANSQVKKTKCYLKNKGDFSSDNYIGKNILTHSKENAMSSISLGIASSNIRVFTSGYLSTLPKMLSSIESSAMMNLPVTYIFTHDTFMNNLPGSINKPVMELSILRSIPNLNVYRPCDHKELLGCWNLILGSNKPSVLILSDKVSDQYKFTSIGEVSEGGYVISEVKNKLDLILIASGSEVSLAMKLKKELLKNFIEARIVSMPNIDAFIKNDKHYQNQVLPKGYKRMFVEFSNDPSIYRLVKDKEDIINISDYVKDGSMDELLLDYELDIPSLIIRIKDSI